MQKQCPICRLQVSPSLDGSCPECGVSLVDAPEVVDIVSASMTSCATCGAFLMGSEESCPSCGVALPRREPSAPVGVVPGGKPADTGTLGAPRPQTAEDAQLWAGLPVGWSADGDTSPDPVPPPKPAAPPPAAAAPPVAAPPPAAAPVPVPVPAPFLSPAAAAPAPVAVPPKPPAAKAPASKPPPMKAPAAKSAPPRPGSGLELDVPKKNGKTDDWDRKWQRAEWDAKRARPRSSGVGRALLLLFGIVVLLGVAGVVAARSFGLFGSSNATATPPDSTPDTPDDLSR